MLVGQGEREDQKDGVNFCNQLIYGSNIFLYYLVLTYHSVTPVESFLFYGLSHTALESYQCLRFQKRSKAEIVTSAFLPQHGETQASLSRFQIQHWLYSSTKNASLQDCTLCPCDLLIILTPTSSPHTYTGGQISEEERRKESTQPGWGL